jgi:tetratricopeptide (TPR) repeat protein
VGDYQAARDKFQTSLKIFQQIGDRAGEAATFYQLGFVAAQSGRLVEGTRLVALCFLIDQAIGHGDAKSDFQQLSKLTAQLNYTQEQVDAMLREVREAYEADQGAGQIQAAFGKA